MKIGYARVNTKDQSLDLQIEALKKAGCTKIYTEVVSGALTERPILNDLLLNLREQDILIIWKLDRLGRSLRHLINIVTDLINRNIGLQSLNDPIDTTTSQCGLIFNIFSSLAEFEREFNLERTNAGLSSAKVKGRVGGRPKGIPKSAEATADAAETLYKDGVLSVREIAKRLGISKTTLYAYLRHRNIPIGTPEKEQKKK